jgi:hypothetical protein
MRDTHEWIKANESSACNCRGKTLKLASSRKPRYAVAPIFFRRIEREIGGVQ